MKRASLRHLGFALFALPAAALLWPVLSQISQAVVGDPSTPFADVLTQFYPFRAFAQVELQQGRLPLWNPYLLSGYSFHGEGQGAVFYPLNLLFAPLSPQVSMNLFALAHFAAAGLFFCLYLRAAGLRRFSACLGGLVYMFSSAPLSRLFAGHFTMLPFLALVPALMWAWESWRGTGGWRTAAGGSVVVGCMGLAGYPQLLFYASLYLGWHVVLESAARRRGRPRAEAAGPLWFFAVVMVCGAALGAVQLLPSFAFARDSFRLQFTYEAIAIFSFSPENLLTLLAPRFFGSLGGGGAPYWGRHLLWENWIYIGIVPLALAFLALARVRGRLVAAHGWAVLVFLVLALGKHTPLHRLLYDFVPFFDYFRGSSKFSFFALFSLASLAGIGADHLLHESDHARQKADRVALAAALAVFAAAGGALWLAFGADPGAAGSTLSRFVRWRLAQGETYLPAALSASPDLARVWAQAYPQLLRLISISLVGLLVVALWPRLHRRYWLACAALSLAVFPDLLQFCAAEPLKAPIGTHAVAPVLLRELESDPERQRVLAPGLSRNALLPHRMASPLGLVGIMSGRYNNFLTAANGADRSDSMIETPVLRASPLFLWPAVSHLVLPEGDGPSAAVATPLARDAGQILYRLREVHPRAAFSRSVTFHSSAEGALADLESGSVDLSATDLLEIPAGVARPRFDAPAPGDRVEILASLPRRTVIGTRAAGARLLVLADTFDPGWRCRLEDGSELKIHPANVAFRGVAVPPGDHTLTFFYRPASFSVGALISVLAVIGLGAAAAAPTAQRWRLRGAGRR